jgi:lysophospholipase L1-like esterase
VKSILPFLAQNNRDEGTRKSAVFAVVASTLMFACTPAKAQNIPGENVTAPHFPPPLGLRAANGRGADNGGTAALTTTMRGPAGAAQIPGAPDALPYADLQDPKPGSAQAAGPIGAELAGNLPLPRVTFHAATNDSTRPQGIADGGLTILQLGDSHTAADFFTGEVRRRLHQRYGDGGPGYIDAGRPHPGIRSATFDVAASPGWSYSALQKSESGSTYYLSGFAAKTSHTGEILTFSARQPVPYDLVEIEVATGPQSGVIKVAFDSLDPIEERLATPRADHLVYRFMPDGKEMAALRRISITTAENQPVTIASVGIYNRRYGVSYSNIGFPGATVDLLNKFQEGLFSDELKRLAPQIVVLGFGTNEGFNDNLNLERYRAHYLEVIRRIRASLPDVRIVMIAPPQAGRKVPGCSIAANCRPYSAEAAQCDWPSPPQLARVRDIQQEIAQKEGIAIWNWAGIMPEKCAAHAWHTAATPLVTADHVHFTAEGYRLSADRFAEFLFPIVDSFKSKAHALSDH